MTNKYDNNHHTYFSSTNLFSLNYLQTRLFPRYHRDWGLQKSRDVIDLKKVWILYFYLPKGLRFAKWVVIFIVLKQVRESIQTQIFHVMVDFEVATKFRIISPGYKFQDTLVKISIKCKVRVAMNFQSYSLDPRRELRLITPLNNYRSRLCLFKFVLQQWPRRQPPHSTRCSEMEVGTDSATSTSTGPGNV